MAIILFRSVLVLSGNPNLFFNDFAHLAVGRLTDDLAAYLHQAFTGKLRTYRKRYPAL